ncbi:MAG: glycoside hydrolase family 2, partial [Bacteroidota bacterium]
YFVNFKVVTKEAKNLVPVGHVEAKEQINLPVGSNKEVKVDLSEYKPLSFNEKENEVIIKANETEIVFDKNKGCLVDYMPGNKNVLKAPLRPMFWRAVTDNDLGNNTPVRLGIWKEAGERMQVRHFEIDQDTDKKVKIKVKLFDEQSQSAFSSLYTVFADGRVKVDNHFKAPKNLPDLPRLGMMMHIDNSLKTLKWLGRGPHENYADRKTSAFVGFYEGTVWEQFHPYVRPQETGYKTDLRWMSMTGNDGKGLLIKGDPLYSGSVLPFDYTELYHQGNAKVNKHGGSIKEGDVYSVFIDFGQKGVGGDNSWGARVHPEYCIPAGEYNYSFVIMPVTKEKDLPQ